MVTFRTAWRGGPTVGGGRIGATGGGPTRGGWNMGGAARSTGFAAKGPAWGGTICGGACTATSVEDRAGVAERDLVAVVEE
ncbi:MAG: hypothetical protein IPF99_02565 [Deltaproteobacteria bacterium]|nr:hypothetical protein [Deltaproteobacteria bacterium]